MNPGAANQREEKGGHWIFNSWSLKTMLAEDGGRAVSPVGRGRLQLPKSLSGVDKGHAAGIPASRGLLHHQGNQHPRNGCYPPLGQEMSQTKPCFSAPGIKVQRQLQGNRYRAAKPLMNDSKRLIVLPKTGFFKAACLG